ncbi:MAG: hypothetical protein J6O17_09705 [Eubacterium sp.]|nr:hypothetical protein [Eubacterium sp.]
MKRSRLKWNKLDNTGNLFPVIAKPGMSNVYRVSVLLKEDIREELLQKALEQVLPYFDMFQSCMKKGIFWYYLESSPVPFPKVKKENTYPCLYIDPDNNKNDHLFRLSYYKNRINLEVFHAVTDGNGALSFLKEITYQYIRNAHPELKGVVKDSLAAETSLNNEDSYVQNYKKKEKKTYKTKRAVVVKGDKFIVNQLGIIHGIINLQDIKRVSKSYGVTINQYLVGVYAWAIYKSYLKQHVSKYPISIACPVNLRPYFDSDTNKNFFVMVSAVYNAMVNNASFEEVLKEISISLKEQITKENLERLFSYNVSNEMNMILRAIPLFIKKIAIAQVYNASAKANTTTLTNLGIQKVAEPYGDYIERFQAMLAMSKGQSMKCTVLSYKDTLVATFSANIIETGIQRAFFRKLTEDGIQVTIETNGAYYD